MNSDPTWLTQMKKSSQLTTRSDKGEVTGRTMATDRQLTTDRSQRASMQQFRQDVHDEYKNKTKTVNKISYIN